jgi:hypothetical protein
MTWTGVGWRDAGNYGPGGMFEAQRDLGRYIFPEQPEVGFVIVINGEQYEVTYIELGFCRVRPVKDDE